MKIKTFLLGFISVYLLLSVPALLGIGSVIDWVRKQLSLKNLMES